MDFIHQTRKAHKLTIYLTKMYFRTKRLNLDSEIGLMGIKYANVTHVIFHTFSINKLDTLIKELHITMP